ncbi:ROK family protein [Cohnella pontilimi]|uniref:ROK family protein n=1 Tax=Cohnella pontilimi TaxID=2564100 RepID=A0A4U0F5E1_9BACL|nr:ROK family protein [Cohnella pontilimi]TJY39835.1 ROK family protein [Cohnella pontilimi]
MERYFIGMDIGGTNTELGMFNADMKLLDVRTFGTIKPHWPNVVSDPHDYLDLLEREIRELLQRHGLDVDRVEAIGGGVPGIVDPMNGISLGASNLGWKNVPFAAEMKRRLGVPVYIDNDVRIYTLGEAHAGAGVGHRHILSVTLGTGLAACVLLDGRPLRGSTLFAGEIGHDPVEGATFRCNCGKTGCLETIASATGIARLAESGLSSHPESILNRVAGGKKLNAHDVFLACEEGDSFALDVFTRVGTILGRRLASFMFLINPEVVIVGGGASRAGDYLLNPIRAQIREYYHFSEPKVTAAALGNLAGLHGSVHFARNYERLQA